MDKNAGVRGCKMVLCVSLHSLHTHASNALRDVPPAFHHLEALPTCTAIDIAPLDAVGVVRACVCPYTFASYASIFAFAFAEGQVEVCCCAPEKRRLRELGV